MNRTGAIIGWSSGAIVAAGLLFAGLVNYQLASGRWVAYPPPPGFGFGGPNDGMTACLPDVRAYCPNAIELARIACVLANRARVSASCTAALAGGAN